MITEDQDRNAPSVIFVSELSDRVRSFSKRRIEIFGFSD